jgi:hypothetical protein
MFPPEIIDHILSFLQWERATLKVCARGHPSLEKLVERHLYAHLTVERSPSLISDDYEPSDLLKCIVDSPNIANHVRSLRISVFRGDCQPLESILPMVTQLQAFSLSGISVGWDDLPESFRTAITNCLRLPTLTNVNISNINSFPLSALDHSSSLKRLSLSGIFHRLASVSPPFYYPPLDLILDDCSSTSTEIITSWVESRNLHSLRSNGDLGQVSRLLEVCANTLTTLMVRIPDDCTHITFHCLRPIN